MGEIADAMINGEMCSLCGCYFYDPETDGIYEHGYPVVCKECWAGLTKEERKEHQKAKVNTL